MSQCQPFAEFKKIVRIWNALSTVLNIFNLMKISSDSESKSRGNPNSFVSVLARDADVGCSLVWGWGIFFPTALKCQKSCARNLFLGLLHCDTIVELYRL